MAIAVTSADKIVKPRKTSGRQLKASLVSSIRKAYQKSKTIKPSAPRATAVGALVIAVTAGGVLLLSGQTLNPEVSKLAAREGSHKSALVPPVTPASALVKAANEAAPADLAPVVSKAIAVSASKKIAELVLPIQISEVQRLLAKLDFRPGPPDGVLGHRTVKAIRLYQKFGGLEITGHATPDLLVDLRAVAARMPEPAG